MFNEEKVANRCISKVIEHLKKESKMCLLIVVNDGSNDKSASILNMWGRKERKLLKVIHHKNNKGYGGAIQTGINEAVKMKFDYCLTMDSDLTNDPKYIRDFIKASENGYDCIKASRYISGSNVVNVPYFRIFISSVGNRLASSLFNIGITDCTNGFRMARVLKLKGIKFKENNFSVILEELYMLKRRGAIFTEIPYTLTARTNSNSHFSYKPKVFYDYFKYAIMAMFLH